MLLLLLLVLVVAIDVEDEEHVTKKKKYTICWKIHATTIDSGPTKQEIERE